VYSMNISRPGQYVPPRKPARRSPNEPSPVSRTSDKSGPSTEEPALITSKWGIGWQTPTLMLSSYVLGTNFERKPRSSVLTFKQHSPSLLRISCYSGTLIGRMQMDRRKSLLNRTSRQLRISYQTRSGSSLELRWLWPLSNIFGISCVSRL
jgi:hypothetical protein